MPTLPVTPKEFYFFPPKEITFCTISDELALSKNRPAYVSVYGNTEKHNAGPIFAVALVPNYDASIPEFLYNQIRWNIHEDLDKKEISLDGLLFPLIKCKSFAVIEAKEISAVGLAAATEKVCVEAISKLRDKYTHPIIRVFVPKEIIKLNPKKFLAAKPEYIGYKMAQLLATRFYKNWLKNISPESITIRQLTKEHRRYVIKKLFWGDYVGNDTILTYLRKQEKPKI